MKIQEEMEESRTEDELDDRRGLRSELWRDSGDDRIVRRESSGEGGVRRQ